MGRAGRNGASATATLISSLSNIDHASAWIRDHLHTSAHVKRVLDEFSSCWQYAMCHLAGKCRRQTLLELFAEDTVKSTDMDVNCCDVCQGSTCNKTTNVDCKRELAVLVNAIDTIGEKGEVKLAQWIRGTSLQWTNDFDKTSMSYGNAMGHSKMWWRLFMRQCHVLGLLRKELRSILKRSGHYSIQGVMVVLAKARNLLSLDVSLLLPCITNIEDCK